MDLLLNKKKRLGGLLRFACSRSYEGREIGEHSIIVKVWTKQLKVLS